MKRNTLKRLWQTIVINMHIDGPKRTSWMKKHKVFANMGNNVSLQLHKIPLFPELISFHNNIIIAANVSFITHDAINCVINRKLNGNVLSERVGCIEIMDNCFIGANTTILMDVRIGPDSIVGANSLVTQDIPPGEIWGGTPARKIGNTKDFIEKRRRTDSDNIGDASELWDKFYEKRAVKK